MPHTPQHQFDPVAASAIAALNSTQRAQRTIRQQAGLPAPPGAEGAFNQARSVLQQVSSMSPLNMLGTQGGPQLPGMSGQGGLPSPQELLPGQGAAGGLPSPQELLPGQMAAGGFPPFPGQQAPRGPSGRRQRPDRAQNGGSNGGAAETEEDTSAARQSAETRN